MSYVDSVLDRDKDKIIVVERDNKGVRQYIEYPTNYLFYYPDSKGKYKGTDGKSLSRFSTKRRIEFEKEKRIHSKNQLYESDVNVVFRCLSENYIGKDAPKLHTAFFDIEVDWKPAEISNDVKVKIRKADTADQTITVKDLRNLKNNLDYTVWDSRLDSWVRVQDSTYMIKGDKSGFASPQDPFNPVTAISLYLDWLGQLVTLVIAPKHYSSEMAQHISSEFENCIVFTNEIEMFETFFQLIEDADVLTGWNSEGYDIPYMVNRVTRVMSKDDTRKFCLMGHLPKPREYERFGKTETTYDLVGRIHMDYLQLYKKYNYESRHSYKLDFIGEMEVGENKTQYEGSLDQLYNKDFKKFIEYNRQDTMLLVKIHNKLQFLDLANSIAHQNTVLLPTAMGSVAQIEMAIINKAHSMGMVVPDKQEKEADDQAAAGAYVATPKKGISEWIGGMDIASLYPSVIRALNMAPETIVAQVRPTLTQRFLSDKGKKLASQKARFKEGDDDVTGSMLWEGLFGSLEYTAIMNQERGTILDVDYEDGRSVAMSAAEIWKMVFDSNKPWMISANGTIFTYEKMGVIPALLTEWYSDRKIQQKKMKESTTKEDQEYWDKRQLVRKILLNSAYGALLNSHCRFWDKRIGQSVTLTGRQIVKHMMSQTNEIITNSYKHDGDAIVYGDTDSCFFTAVSLKPIVEADGLAWNKDNVVKLYDTIAEQVNQTFPEFMEKAFHTTRKNGAIINAGRELVADRGLFITKKRYALNIYDKEGKRQDINGKMGKIKAMGLDLKRADTPKYVQEFLMTILEMVLAGKQRDEVISAVKNFKVLLSAQKSWTKGSPKSVNKLTHYKELEDNSKTGRANLPGHVRAALNWNYLRRLNGDNYSMMIVDGMKIVTCKLKSNPLNFTSIAYPTDELRLPEWFIQLPFDDHEMERTLVDEKIDNLLSVLNWDIRHNTDILSTFDDLFEIG
jgi:DNA polymerase elongation subunit (family B)